MNKVLRPHQRNVFVQWMVVNVELTAGQNEEDTHMTV